MSASITLSPLTTALVEFRKLQPSNHKSQLEVRTTSSLANENSKLKFHEARNNVSDKITIGFGFESDWLRRWREFSGPIMKRNQAKPKEGEPLRKPLQPRTYLTS